MITMAYFVLGVGIGIIISEIKNWFFNRDLLDRATFRNPADYFYVQHMREEIKTQIDPLKTFRNLSPFKKKPKVDLKDVVAEDMKVQMEKQELGTKELEEREKKRIELRSQQIRMGTGAL